MRSFRPWCVWLGLTLLVGALLSVMAAASATAQDAESSSQIDAQLQEVMSDPLFSRWRQRQARAEVDSDLGEADLLLSNYGESWGNRLERFLEWLFERDRKPTSHGGNSRDDSGAWFGSIGDVFRLLGWALLGLAIIGMGWALLAFFVGRQRAASSATPDRKTLSAALDQADALAAESTVWVDHARQLVQEQDLRLAFRAMYLALLSGLHTAGKIRYRPQRTNHWYVQSFRGTSPQRESFASLTDRFAEVWYGQRPPDTQAFDRIGGEVKRLLDSTPDVSVASAGPGEEGGRP